MSKPKWWYPIKAFSPGTLFTLARGDSIRYTKIFFGNDWWGLIQKVKQLPAKCLLPFNKTTKDLQGFWHVPHEHVSFFLRDSWACINVHVPFMCLLPSSCQRFQEMKIDVWLNLLLMIMQKLCTTMLAKFSQGLVIAKV
jgi:hypothetical protein